MTVSGEPSGHGLSIYVTPTDALGEPSGHDLSLYSAGVGVYEKAGSVVAGAGAIAQGRRVAADYKLEVTAFMASPPGYEMASRATGGTGLIGVAVPVAEEPVGPFMALLVGHRPSGDVAPPPPVGTVQAAVFDCSGGESFLQKEFPSVSGPVTVRVKMVITTATAAAIQPYNYGADIIEVYYGDSIFDRGDGVFPAFRDGVWKWWTDATDLDPTGLVPLDQVVSVVGVFTYTGGGYESPWTIDGVPLFPDGVASSVTEEPLLVVIGGRYADEVPGEVYYVTSVEVSDTTGVLFSDDFTDGLGHWDSSTGSVVAEAVDLSGGGVGLGWDVSEMPLAIRMFDGGTEGGGTVSPVLPLGGGPDFGPPPLSSLAKSLLDYLPPYEADDPRVQNLLAAVANELARVDARAKDLIFRFFPQNADDRYGTLALWESLLGLPVMPPDATLSERQSLVLTTLRSRNVGTGERWTDLLIQAFGTDDFTVQEGPSDYTVTIRIPMGSSFTTATARRVARRITPAHLQIAVGFEGGFLIGISLIGDAL